MGGHKLGGDAALVLGAGRAERHGAHPARRRHRTERVVAVAVHLEQHKLRELRAVAPLLTVEAPRVRRAGVALPLLASPASPTPAATPTPAAAPSAARASLLPAADAALMRGAASAAARSCQHGVTLIVAEGDASTVALLVLPGVR